MLLFSTPLFIPDNLSKNTINKIINQTQNVTLIKFKQMTSIDILSPGQLSLSQLSRTTQDQLSGFKRWQGWIGPMSKVKCSKGLLKGLWTFFFSFLKVIHEAKWFVSQKIVQIFFSREATLGLVLSVLPSIYLSHYFIKSHQESSRVNKSQQESGLNIL